tara:strand:+ start:303 stop:692 length:390 start_codon:yes stop_codon:yes gene_type:complete
MNFFLFLKKFFYYFFTSGLFISLGLSVLEIISKFYNFVNVFAFASASLFLINLMQYNVIAENNSLAVKGFLIHTLLGVSCYWFLAFVMLIIYNYKYNRTDINTIMLSLIVITFIIYIYSYKKGYLNFLG